MATIQSLGRRIELLPMDAHFEDISIALYVEEEDGKPVYRVHSYSAKLGASDRISFIRNAMCALGDLEPVGEDQLRFLCGNRHTLAAKRTFLEACKLPSNMAVVPKPLEILDKKSGLTAVVSPDDQGVYRVSTEGEGKNPERRVKVIAGGLAKLGEMESVDDEAVKFPCGSRHDALAGLLLVRAPNVRAVTREDEASASRGVLAAPSQQR